MKKKLILTMLTIFTVSSVFGCGQTEEPAPDTEEVITVAIKTSVKAPTAMTREELASLQPGAVKEMVETYLPNYRAIYGIDAAKEMTDEDWTGLRDLIYEQLYGVEEEEEEVEDPAKWIDFSNPALITNEDGELLDPDWIYYAPCQEYIESLTDRQFAQYMNDLMDYYDKPHEAVSFETMTTSELDEMRLKVITDFCIPWGDVTIPTAAEAAAEKELQNNGGDLPTVEVGDSEEETEDPAEETDENAEEDAEEEDK